MGKVTVTKSEVENDRCLYCINCDDSEYTCQYNRDCWRAGGNEDRFVFNGDKYTLVLEKGESSDFVIRETNDVKTVTIEEVEKDKCQYCKHGELSPEDKDIICQCKNQYGKDKFVLDTNKYMLECETEIHDNVNNPKHYAGTCSIECIEAMTIAFGFFGTAVFCLTNCFKYLWRHKNKNGYEDIQKAKWYLSKAKELLNNIGGKDFETVLVNIKTLEHVLERYENE